MGGTEATQGKADGGEEGSDFLVHGGVIYLKSSVL